MRFDGKWYDQTPHWEYMMRANVMIDDDLIAEAMQTSGATTTGEVVDLALRALIRAQAYEELRSLRGRLRWEGDLDAMRRD